MAPVITSSPPRHHSPEQPTYNLLLSSLPLHPSLFHPHKQPHCPETTGKIADLALHPAMEAALHILNDDLQSAHFLVRKMQAGPAYEGVLFHAILHRVNGDYDSSRAWYHKLTDSSLLSGIWGEHGGIDGAIELVDDIEAFSKGTRHGQINGEFHYAVERQKALEGICEQEFQRILRWCEEKFGTGRWEDASEEYVEVHEGEL